MNLDSIPVACPEETTNDTVFPALTGIKPLIDRPVIFPIIRPISVSAHKGIELGLYMKIYPAAGAV
jgi:hypothetical protein